MDKLKEKLARFMYGRYGSDRLNIFMVIVLLICAVINLFVRTGYFSVLLTSWEFLLLILIYFRMFSRNISKRYAENQKSLEIENKEKRFFGRQKIRIPKGKGKISIRCPKCGAEFVKKS